MLVGRLTARDNSRGCVTTDGATSVEVIKHSPVKKSPAHKRKKKAHFFSRKQKIYPLADASGSRCCLEKDVESLVATETSTAAVAGQTSDRKDARKLHAHQTPLSSTWRPTQRQINWVRNNFLLGDSAFVTRIEVFKDTQLARDSRRSDWDKAWRH